jgi:hypothetical protein
MEETGFDYFRDMFMHGELRIKDNTECLHRVRERDTSITHFNTRKGDTIPSRRRTTKKCFGLVLVELQPILRHPGPNLITAGLDFADCIKGKRGVSRNPGVELGVVSEKMISEIVRIQKSCQLTRVEREQKRPKNGALRHTIEKRSLRGKRLSDKNLLHATMQVG